MLKLMDNYRLTHRRLRDLLNPYTSLSCPTCPKPCCNKPTMITEWDIIFANILGVDIPSVGDSASKLARSRVEVIKGEYEAGQDGQPCDFLGEHGCTFPDDLRPYECTIYMCPTLKRTMPQDELNRVDGLLEELGDLQKQLVENLEEH